LKVLKLEPIVVHTDERGRLCKVHPESVGGEVYTVETRVGESRGHHFHRKMGEWFTAVAGQGVVVAENPETGERAQAQLKDQRVYVPAGWAHALFNTGTESLLVLACADNAHDPADVHPYPVSAPQ
jgi:oxalate decarboxylase/phosphoglucose isomerase-like protein (cupin superfamily)